MSGAHLELACDLPDGVGRILEMESESPAFLELAEAYDAVTSEIQDIETGIEPVSPAYHAQLRRQRDEIRDILRILLDA